MKRLRFIFLITISLNFLIFNGQVYAESIEATDIELNTEYSDQLSTAKEIDFFKFNLPADGNVVVTFRHEGFSDNNAVHWNIYLYGEIDLENPLGSAAIKATDRTASFSVGIKSGFYFVKVMPSGSHYSSGYSNWWDDQYFISVNSEENNYYEKSPNHTPNMATTIDLNTEYSANLAFAYEVDYFKFSLPVDGNVIVSFKHEGFKDSNAVHWNVYLYGEADLENPLGSAAIKATDKSALFSVGIKSGFYFVKVMPSGSHYSSGYSNWWDDQYFISVKFEESNYYEKSPNNNPNLATLIEFNKKYSANLAFPYEIDYFKFSLPINGDVTLNFRHQESRSDAPIYWNVYLFGEANLDESINSIAITGAEMTASFTVEIGAGTYFVKVMPSGSHYSSGYSNWWNDQYFLEVQTDIVEPVCPQVVTYGKNPVSGSWIAFPTPCDMPKNWITQNTKPDGPCPACPVEVACPEPEVTVCPEPEVTTCPEPETNTTIAATLSSTFELHVPDVQYEGMSFWADLVNVPSSDENLLFQVTDYGQN
jgi:hypothetical protein